MKQKKLSKNPLVLVITVLVGVIAAILIHSHTWFKFEKSFADIELTAPIQVNTATTNMNLNQVAIDDLGYSVVVWADPGGTDMDVYFQRFDNAGNKLGGETVAHSSTANDQYQPHVAMDQAGNFVIVWSGYNPVTTSTDIYMRAFQADGTPLGSESIINTTTANEQSNPRVSMDYNGPFDNERFVVSWTHFNGSDFDINFRLFDADFTQTVNPPSTFGPETLMNTEIATGNQHPSDVAMNNLGQFIISANNSFGLGSQAVYKIYRQNGTPMDALAYATDATKSTVFPKVAADKKARSTLNDTDDMRFGITYGYSRLTEYNIGTQLIGCTDSDPGNGNDDDIDCAITSPELIDGVSTSTGKNEPDIDMDWLGDFTIAWYDEIDGSDSGIAAQSYNYKGQKINITFQVNDTVTSGVQEYTTIAMNTEGFYDITFNDFPTGNLYYKKYVTEIYKVFGETLAHTPYPASTQSTLVTAMSPTNNQVIVWKDFGTTPSELKFTLQSIDRTDPANPFISTLIGDTDYPDNVVVAGNNVDNPSVAFFKDSNNCNKFIIAWENDTGGGNGKDIFYQIYDSAGNPEYLTPQTLVSTANEEIKPVVAAGIYNDGVDDVKIFSIGWIDNTASKMESIFHDNGIFTQTTISSNCNSEDCIDIRNTLNPDNNRVVYLYETGTTEIARSLFIQQLNEYTLVGNAVEVHPVETWNPYSDIDFIDDNDFVVVYSMNGNNDILGTRYAFDDVAGGDLDTDPDFVEDFDVSRHYVSYISISNQDLHPKVSAFPTDDPNLQQFLVTWQLWYPDTHIEIMGQFLDYSGTSIIPFGPSFMINSSRVTDSIYPDVGYNRYGMGIIAWEGETSADAWGIAYQLIQNPTVSEDMTPLQPVCQQQITAGGLTMIAPSTISFPSVSTSATETVTQSVSIRDPVYGGDAGEPDPKKYIEVRDAKGEDFTLSIQVTSFVSAEDGETYIKNNEHFRLKNWDGDITDTDVLCGPAKPLSCYLTTHSSYSPTAFGLNNETSNYVYADTQKVLATKSDTTDNEIGAWRFYPKFEITVPPIIPAGTHEAEITFTLVN